MSDERFVDGPPAGAEGWRDVWAQNRRYRSGGAAAFVRRVLRRFIQPDLDLQRDFNLATLDLLRDVRREIEALRHDLKSDLAAVQSDMRDADESLARLIPIVAKRNDGLVAALDQKIETVAARFRDLTNPVWGAGAPAGTSSADFLYRRLEDGLRGSEAEVREAMRTYVELARNAQPVIDVGCGRGEFLALCREAGIHASGFDTNERSVADLKQRGFDVTLAGIPECLEYQAAGSIGTIVATHVVEHLSIDALFAFFREAARAVRSGGVVIIETPNAESILVGASQFWRDPTHIAPRHPAALTVLAREHGFAIDEIAAVHPFPE
ncbi:MAG: class I SAM-dependent methyltransferase, partial [Thermoanaerobaculia bacterium]